MRTLVFWVATALIFGTFNSLVAYKEAMIRSGTTMYLKLAPVDPRSLMQGDYMALRYELAQNASPRVDSRRGQLVVQLDENQVAHFVRMHRGEPLGEGEHLLRFVRRPSGLRVGTNAFFFQEGHASSYANAEYGELKVAPSGESVLVGLREADFSKSGGD